MSEYYNATRIKNLYTLGSSEPFKLSRSKIDLFLECPRCFYLDRRLGVGRVPGFPFALNSAVDALLKKEFDMYRARGEAHPLQQQYNIDAIPAPHPNLERWRANFTGIQHLHEETNFLVFGAIDDLWITSAGEYVVADYKATSKDESITVLDRDWHEGYKRQMEVYQWLLRHNGLSVSSTGYFVYCNGDASKEVFNQTLMFDVTLIPYTGDDSWVVSALRDAKHCLDAETLPAAVPDCDHCAYVAARAAHEYH